MKLTGHFTLEEMTQSQSAARLGLDNTPSPAAIDHLRKTAALLEQVRALWGKPIIVTSGYRAPQVNKAVGGSMYSQHMIGQAADFIIPGVGSPLEICQTINAASPAIPYDQVIHEFQAWVHISWSMAPRRMTLTIDAHGTRSGFK
ncbi:MAG: DUF882 domain-containing protein [Rhodospirillales bacterium]|nr:DUF882 domain-containing protein [Rhodospirillales bacterium]